MAKPKDLDLGDWNRMLDSFYSESDRGAAILAGSFAEHSLGLYLRFRMRDQKVADALFGATGPLSSFSQRIAIAYAFGFISESKYRDFEGIRRIRNHFAHHPMDATFETPEIKQTAQGLSMMEHAQETQHPRPIQRSRVAYLLTCGLLCGSLLDAIEKGEPAKVDVK